MVDAGLMNRPASEYHHLMNEPRKRIRFNFSLGTPSINYIVQTPRRHSQRVQNSRDLSRVHRIFLY